MSRRMTVQITRNGIETTAGPSEWFTSDRFMTHLSSLEVDDDGDSATWGDHVTDEEYAVAPSTDR